MDPREPRDSLLEALDALLEAFEHNSRRIELARRRAEAIKKARREGRPYREIVSAENRPLIVEITRQNLEALGEAGSRFRREEARHLHEEGMTMQEIAELFGVTRQRISALLKGGPDVDAGLERPRRNFPQTG